ELAADADLPDQDLVLQPLQHDSPGELSDPYDVREWRKGECDLIPGKTLPNMMVVNRDYKHVYERFTTLGPLAEKLGNGGQGIAWGAKEAVELLRLLNGRERGPGAGQGHPRIYADIDVCQTVLTLTRESNCHVAL